MAQLKNKPALGLMVIAILFVSLNLRPAISSIGPLLEAIRRDLSLSNSEISLLTSIPVFCMGLFAPLAIGFNRKFGIKKSITFLIAMLGALTFVRGLFPTYPVLLASSFFIGLAIAVISPLLSAAIKTNFPGRTASLIGVYSFGMGLGAMLASGLTGVFYTLAGWPLALASWGVLALIALPFWLRVKEPPKTYAVDAGSPAKPPWKNKRAWTMLLFFGFQSAMFFSLITWLAPIAIDKGMNVLTAGAVLTVMAAVQLVGNLSLPVLLARFPSRLLWIFLSLLSGVAGLLLLLFGGAVATWAAAVFLGIMLGCLFPIALLMPLDENEHADDVNSWTAMIQSGGYIISSGMPFLIGMLYDRWGDHSITLYLLLSFAALVMLFGILLYRNEIKQN
ncbi:CP family cyanate transporter-like MFS transporter [Planomicrobium koreense]|uniref:CP family cyanate transporter-like MFS transporter n=2 Tax=Planococcus koreensis TaxID=112331 RepID=A0A7W8FS31_9BACL|nr:MFS transporter [Planococcus koreensis]MBB5178586.1 CP family cyanate transporter-like MFS transporter [Planococcus koreensis]